MPSFMTVSFEEYVHSGKAVYAEAYRSREGEAEHHAQISDPRRAAGPFAGADVDDHTRKQERNSEKGERDKGLDIYGRHVFKKIEQRRTPFREQGINKRERKHPSLYMITLILPNVMPFALHCRKNRCGGALFLVYLAQRGDADLKRALAVADADHRLAPIAHA